MAFALIPRSPTQLPAHRFGGPQRSGPLTMVPLFGPDHGPQFVPPLSGLKLAGVRGYGNVDLHNPAPDGVAILPLHVGYIQDQAQNHALCASGFLGAGQKRLFEDACCVQQAQGGYLESKEQWFFVLPLALREEALALRGQKNFGKLWPAISRLNDRFGLQQRGHLEQLVCRQRPVLTQYQSRLELQRGQTGALFFLGDRLVGVELAPNAAYFREAWMPLACFCYGTAALERERLQTERPPALPFPANSLAELRDELAQSRRERDNRVLGWLAATPAQEPQRREEERYLGLRLYTAEAEHFTGQYVEDEGRLVYASLTARASWLAGASWRPGDN
jgi:hypothetical protein